MSQMNMDEAINAINLLQEKMKDSENRIEKLEKKQDTIQDLIISVKLMENKTQNIESSLKEVKDAVNEIAMKPAHKWENMISQIISIIVAGVISYCMARIGIG